MIRDAGIGFVIFLWVAFAVTAVLSAVLFSGKGTGLIAGYNTASPKEREKYDEKKMSFVTGSGMAFVSLLELLLALCASVFPFFVFFIFQGAVLLDCIVVVVLLNTVCKKKK